MLIFIRINLFYKYELSKFGPRSINNHKYSNMYNTITTMREDMQVTTTIIMMENNHIIKIILQESQILMDKLKMSGTKIMIGNNMESNIYLI